MLGLLLVAGTVALMAAPAHAREMCAPRAAANFAVPPQPDDWDCDSVTDTEDNCPPLGYDDLRTRNPNQQNSDLDEWGDWCDADDDADGIPDWQDGRFEYNTAFPRQPRDNCRIVPNPEQIDRDNNGIGDACEGDGDEDGFPDVLDNCPARRNADQADLDRDAIGDVCDDDNDGDNVLDTRDNCPRVTNPVVLPDYRQPDADGDGLGDACDTPPPATTDPAPTPTPTPAAAAVVAPVARVLDRQAPRVMLSLRSALRLAEVESGLVVRLHCSEACAVSAELVADRRLARRLRGTTVVARGTAAVEAAATTYAFVRFDARARTVLWKLSKAGMTLRVSVTDSSGNVRRVSERVSLRR